MDFSPDLIHVCLMEITKFFPCSVTTNLCHYILRSLALMATMTVLALMRIAPMSINFLLHILDPQLGHIGHIALPDILCIYVVVDIYRFLHGIPPDPLHMVSAHPGPE